MISSIQDASNRRRSAVDEELVEKKVAEPKNNTRLRYPSQLLEQKLIHA